MLPKDLDINVNVSIQHIYLLRSTFPKLNFFLVDLVLIQLRVDGVLIRLRETRMHCIFAGSANPVVLRETCWRESTFQALSA
ncbi:TIP41-like protein, partial [Trifolium medium]|nr:TIP41-like protein [Trifolium medium]